MEVGVARIGAAALARHDRAILGHDLREVANRLESGLLRRALGPHGAIADLGEVAAAVEHGRARVVVDCERVRAASDGRDAASVVNVSAIIKCERCSVGTAANHSYTAPIVKICTGIEIESIWISTPPNCSLT